MAINNIAMKAYSEAVKNNADLIKSGGSLKKGNSLIETPTKSFAATVADSLNQVQGLETQKKAMIESFVAGREHNVHELMITMQKAGLAVGMTAAVRGKVLETYKQLMQMQI